MIAKDSTSHVLIVEGKTDLRVLPYLMEKMELPGQMIIGQFGLRTLMELLAVQRPKLLYILKSLVLNFLGLSLTQIRMRMPLGTPFVAGLKTRSVTSPHKLLRKDSFRAPLGMESVLGPGSCRTTCLTVCSRRS